MTIKDMMRLAPEAKRLANQSRFRPTNEQMGIFCLDPKCKESEKSNTGGTIR